MQGTPGQPDKFHASNTTWKWIIDPTFIIIYRYIFCFLHACVADKLQPHAPTWLTCISNTLTRDESDLV
ncbi:hypothetical protein SETIT_7G068500v2 [Setaria italica]|uniref:Uncharacterized protein n=2 Tax=Setaria TaxID=4554 RepID=A0A368RSY4_SETIT|nr:hypothetical protein SETIT_7G068500v2 [Setaria italica]TKW03920.1 hypothetical protein SEVIR_7G075200v2 [Setaria viridis]